MRWFVFFLFSFCLQAHGISQQLDHQLNKQIDVLTSLYEQYLGPTGINEFRLQLELAKASVRVLPENSMAVMQVRESAEAQLQNIAQNLAPLVMKLRAGEASPAEHAAALLLLIDAYYTAGATSSNSSRIANEGVKMYTAFFFAGLTGIGASLFVEGPSVLLTSGALTFGSLALITKNTFARDIVGQPFLVPKWLRNRAQKHSTKALMTRFWEQLAQKTGSSSWNMTDSEIKHRIWQTLAMPVCEDVLLPEPIAN